MVYVEKKGMAECDLRRAYYHSSGLHWVWFSSFAFSAHTDTHIIRQLSPTLGSRRFSTVIDAEQCKRQGLQKCHVK